MKNFVRLSEVCTISASKANIEEECAWLLNLDKVESKTGRILEHEVVPREKLNGSIVQFDTENVLYSKLRPNLNKVVLPEENGYATSEMLPLRPCESKLTKGYLAEYLRSDNFVSWAVGKTAGAKMPRLGTKVLMDKMIPLPPLEEQHKIVSLFSVVNHVISLRQQQLAKLDELVKARFVEMFGDSETNPKSWPTIPIGKTITSCESGWSGNGTQRLKKHGEIAVLKVSAVTKGIFIPEECKVLDDQENIKKYIFPQKGDLLFSRANTREMVGATAVVSEDYPEHILPDKLWRIRFNNDVTVWYMKHVLSSPSVRSKFSAVSTGTSGSMYNVSMDKFKSIVIPIPPLHRQQQFADFVEQVNSSVQVIQKSLEQMKTLKEALMQQYFG